MAKLNFVLIGQKMDIDQSSHLISVTNVLETISAPGATLPIPFVDSMLFMLWERTEQPIDALETVRVKLTLESPTGSNEVLEIVKEPLEVRIDPGMLKTKGLMPLGGMPIKADGINRVVVWQEIDGQFVEVGEVTFGVIL